MKTIQIIRFLTLCCLTICTEVLATWSIVAVDPETREVGAAGATCTVGIEAIVGMVPGEGVILAQAATNLDARDKGVQMIAGGGSPRDVIAQIANEKFNAGGLFSAPWTEQQYGVAVLDKKPSVGNFTGTGTVPWSGAIARGRVSVQGNMLYGREVIESTLAAYESYDGTGQANASCHHDLADHLLHALAAGAEKGGDKRCARDRSALTAFVSVARSEDPEGQPSLFLVSPKAFGMLGSIRHRIFPYSPDEDTPPAVSQLRSMYREWKTKHPDWIKPCDNSRDSDIKVNGKSADLEEADTTGSTQESGR